jgi:DNA end-binding protein Ku
LRRRPGISDATEFEDRYETAVVEMLKRKQAGLPPEKQSEAAAPTNVVNLMDALRRSIDAEKPGRAMAPAKRPTERSPAKSRNGGRQREREGELD